MDIDRERFEQKVKTFDDFDLNTMIDRCRKLKPEELPEWVIVRLHVEWRIRHPRKLPPCFAGMDFPDCYEGPREVYQWPQA